MVVLYANISVLNWMRAATGSQCKETKKGVTCALLGSLNIQHTFVCSFFFQPTKILYTEHLA